MQTSERGSMLIVALWSMAILSLMALGAGTSAWTEAKLTSYQLDRLRSERLLQGGVELVRQTLSESGTQTVTMLKDKWAGQQVLFGKITLPDGCMAVDVEDEQGRLNLNTATASMLERLFGDGQEDVVKAILTWRSSASQPADLDRQNDFYEALQRPYTCKVAPLESVEELLMVQGMTPALFERIRPWVTVYTNGQVNINTASRTVLLALGFGDSLADKITQRRLGADGLPGTDDDVVFLSPVAVAADLREAGPLLMDETVALSAALPHVNVRSTSFRAHFKMSPNCGDQEAIPAEVVLAASGLQGQWIIRHFSTL